MASSDTKTSGDEKAVSISSPTPEIEPSTGKGNLHLITRSDEPPQFNDSREHIVGFNASLMGARATLSSAEEKKLLRRIDWHLLPLLAVMYMIKTVDFTNVRVYTPFVLLICPMLTLDQVANARVMDRGTPQNILIELAISSDAFNFVTTAYYVRSILNVARS